MKKVLSLFMAVVMLFSVIGGTGIQAYASDQYDNQYIEANIKQLKNYIATYGGVNSDGNSFIKYTDTDNYTYGILYDYYWDSLQFASFYSESSYDSLVLMDFNGPSTTYPRVAFYFDYYTIDASATLNVSQYTFDTKLNFISNNGNYLDYDDVNLCNIRFQIGMYGWDNLIYNSIGGSLASIGFSALCTQHNNIVSNSVNATCTINGATTYTCTICGKISTVAIPATGHNYGNNSAACVICGIANPNYVAPVTTVKKPKTESIKKLAKGKKSFKVEWKKLSGVTGYQVQYSTDKKFKKSTKTVTVKGYKNTRKTIKKLKGGKKYYVRVRAYNKAKVNGKTKTAYGSWSKVKTVTTKR